MATISPAQRKAISKRLDAFLIDLGNGKTANGEVRRLAPGATVRQLDATTIEVAFADNEAWVYEVQA